MPLSDFTVYTSHAEMVVTIDPGSRLSGTYCLEFQRVGTTQSTIAGNIVGGPSAAGTYVDGAIQVLTKAATGSISAQSHGIICLQSQADMSTAGSAYTLHWSFEALRLGKYTAGLDVASTTLATAAGVTEGTTQHCLRLEWISSNQSGRGGTELKGYHGTAADFSDLALVIHYVDNSSPLTTSAGQGLFAASIGNNAALDFWHDKMSVYSAAPS